MKKGNVPLGRRDFARKLGGIALFSPLVLSSLISCSSDDEDEVNLTDDEMDAIQFLEGEIRLNLDVLSSLNNTGDWILIPERKVLVLNVGEGEYTALTSVCTHTGCDNAWSYAGSILTCACHGSRFDSSGNVINGPASTPLMEFDTELNSNFLIIFR